MAELNLEDKETIKKHLSDQLWRLENLYWIVDRDGKKIKFKLKPEQKYLFENRHYLNVILKARQLGMSTFVAIFFLDSVLFSENQKAFISAHTAKAAQDIFNDKVKFAFDALPEWLKDHYQVDTNNVNTLRFKSNGGSIVVSNSGRSGTVQYLHISEFGITCSEYPEKAREVVTGSLNAIHKDGLVFVESTAAGKSGYFYDFCMEGLNNVAKNKYLSSQDWRTFFFPWYGEESYVLDEPVTIPVELEIYFKELEAKHKIVLSQAQKNWYTKKKNKMGDDMFSEFPSTPEEAFQGSLQGAYYQDQILKLRTDGRLRPVAYDPLLPVYSFWDLGVRDSTSIGFFQKSQTEWRLIDYHEATGEGLEYYAKLLKDKPYNIQENFAPHDIMVRELGTGMTRLEIAEKLGLRFSIVPNIGIDEGINAVRMKLSQLWVDEVRCKNVVDTLARYRKKWNEKLQVFDNKPIHDDSSHVADMIRYWAVMSDELDGGLSTKREITDEQIEMNRHERAVRKNDYAV